MGAQHQIEEIGVDGVRLEVRRWHGIGTPILLLHEGLGSVAMWRDFPRYLADHTSHPVVAWSRQGYGQSDRLPERRTPDYMHDEAARVPMVMEALGIGRAHLFGHSDGGSIALIAAARSPDRVGSLILEAPHVYVEQLTIDSIAAAKTAYQTSDLARRLGRYHADPDHTFWGWNDIWLDPNFRHWNIEVLIGSVTASALLIQGLDDEYGTLDQLDRIEAKLPQARRLELANCGHSPHRDREAEVLSAAASFLKEIGA